MWSYMEEVKEWKLDNQTDYKKHYNHYNHYVIECGPI